MNGHRGQAWTRVVLTAFTCLGLAVATEAVAGGTHGCADSATPCDAGVRGPHGHMVRPPCHHGACGHGWHHGLCRHDWCGHCCRPGHCCLCGPGSCKHDTYEKRYFLRSQGKSWHSAWYDPAEGRPIALVVPPTSEFQTQYGWGVPSSRVAPIYHQFRRPYPGPGAVGGGGAGGFMPTPAQPSDTVQFGVNAVRGPWGSY